MVAMIDFNNCVDHCGLVEHTSIGGSMSWTNDHEGRDHKWAKLHKVLVNTQFINQFPLARLDYLTRKIYDHKPMLIQPLCANNRYGPSPFKY